jgi:hypothetical protein
MEAPPGLNPDESVVKSTSLYRLNRLVRRPLTQPRRHIPPLQLTTLNKSLYRLISPYKETRATQTGFLYLLSRSLSLWVLWKGVDGAAWSKSLRPVILMS